MRKMINSATDKNTGRDVSDTDSQKPPDDVQVPRVSRWLVHLLRPIHTLFMPCFFRLKVTGRAHIPKTGPVILAPTHRSRWDPMLMPCVTMRLLRSMASLDEFVGIQGWFMRHLGAFAVNTRRPSASTLKVCAKILLGRDLLVIYPEGGIFYYPPDHVHPLKPGTAWLALKVQHEMPDADLRVVPIRIRYSQIKPKFRSGAEVVIEPPISVRDYLGMPEKDAIRGLTAAIQERMGDIVNTSTAEASPPRKPKDSDAKQSLSNETSAS
jgi:1-acyl-sn-glycerol-3-phosphate acyltransferase